MKEKGVSLLEVVIVLAITGILLMGLTLSIKGFSTKYRLLSAVWEVNSSLNMARFKAIFRGVDIRVSFRDSAYTLEYFDEPAKTWKREMTGFLDGVAVTANNSPIFHGSGSVSNLASIFISNSWGKYKMTLAISGRVKTVKL